MAANTQMRTLGKVSGLVSLRAKTDVEMIERRLKAAQGDYEQGMAKQAKRVNKVVASSGNVFADLGLPDAAELDTKVRLANAVNRLLESRRLTQAAAATALLINQPKIFALKHYKLEGFSVERLMTFLTASCPAPAARTAIGWAARAVAGSDRREL